MPLTMKAGMPQRADNREAFLRWKQKIASRASWTPDEIIKSLLEECGGLRICLPDLQDLWREHRDHLIRLRFPSLAREVGPREAYNQIALNNDLSVIQVRRIVNGTCGRKKGDEN